MRFRANTGNISEGSFSACSPNSLREFISVRMHVAPVFAPARTQKNYPGEFFFVLVLCQEVINETGSRVCCG